MRVGILDLLVSSAPRSWSEALHNRRFKRQLISITPQAVAAWCRRLGHDVHYATYYGQCDPRRLLPDDLDVVLLSAFTQASALAYALAKLYRRSGTLTVLGGPHARAFPLDCLRFFDLVVHDCDETLIDDILRGTVERNTVVASGRPLQDVPSVEERMPEIVSASFRHGRPTMLSNVPMLSSIGCPYRCDFCIDWNNPFRLLPTERLAADLRFISKQMPGTIVSYHDPNFAVRFDQVMEVMETIPRGARNPFVMGSSLTILRGERLGRLREVNCAYVAPGIESWADYSNKAAVGREVGAGKMEKVVEHFEELHEYVPGLGACFIFGTDADAGDEPIELTTEFVRRVPYVWPQMNIPMPYGGTPMFDSYLAEDRILKSMPFSFYYVPYIVTKFRHYTPLEYYEQLIRFYAAVTSPRMLRRRVQTTRGVPMKALQLLRTLSMRDGREKLRAVWWRLKNDGELRAFHEGRTERLPEYYLQLYRGRLGPYAELMTEADMTPELAQLSTGLVAPAASVSRSG